MTQEDYQLWTGEALMLEDGEWCSLVKVASGRLASFLCLDSLPTPLPDDLCQTLADFICAVRARRGSGAQVESKSVRNFTIRFRSQEAVNAFDQIAKEYPDIIGKYSQCGSSVEVERTVRSCCDGCF